jgi:hypothetical protein
MCPALLQNLADAARKQGEKQQSDLKDVAVKYMVRE